MDCLKHFRSDYSQASESKHSRGIENSHNHENFEHDRDEQGPEHHRKTDDYDYETRWQRRTGGQDESDHCCYHGLQFASSSGGNCVPGWIRSGNHHNTRQRAAAVGDEPRDEPAGRQDDRGVFRCNGRRHFRKTYYYHGARPGRHPQNSHHCHQRIPTGDIQSEQKSNHDYAADAEGTSS